MKHFLQIILAIPFLIWSLSGNTQTVTTAPAGTVVVTSPVSGTALGNPGGKTWEYTNPSWPAFESPCLTYGFDEIITGIINGYNPSPTCSGLNDLTYDPLRSDLSNGIIYYTGTTTYRYLTTGGFFTTNTTIPTRVIITFTDAVAAPVPVYNTNNVLVIQADQDFDMNVIIEAYSPSGAQYISGGPNQWTPAITLFDNLHTDPASIICTSFNPGDFYTFSISASAMNTGPYCEGETIQISTLTSQEAAGSTVYEWTGPNSYNSFSQNNSIPNATTAMAGYYVVTATDPIGCVAMDSTNVVVNPYPTFVNCPTDIIQSNTPGSCSASVSWTPPTASNSCPAIITSSHNPGDIFTLGTTTVTYTITDSYGNTDNCSFTVTIQDNEAPVITCPTNIVVNADAGSCGAIVNYTDLTATDNCDSATIEVILNGSFENGLNNWTYINNPSPFGGGWQATNSINIWTPFGPIDPTDGSNLAGNGFDGGAGVAMLYQDVTVPASGAILQWDDQLDYNLQDFCSGCSNRVYEVQIRNTSGAILATAYSKTAFSGTIENGIWQSHIYDMSAFAGQTVRITFYQLIPDNSTGPGQYGLDNVSLSTYPIINQTSGLPSASLFPIGVTTNTYVATDSSGNTSSCSFTVTVVDNEAPVISCQNISKELDASGNVSITAGEVLSSATDNCSIISMTVSPATFSCSDLGSNSVLVTVTDNYGNISTCNVTVTILDNLNPCNQAPVAICQNITIPADTNCEGNAVAADVDNGSSDPDGDALTYTITPAGPYPIGTTLVTLTVTDPSGEFDQCTANITVEDITDPVVLCSSITRNTDAGLCSYTVIGAEFDAVSSDNCGVNTVVWNLTGATTGSGNSTLDGTIFNIGTTSIEWIVNDVAGNSTTCNGSVTIFDMEAPTFTGCPAAPITAVNDAGLCGAVVTWTAPTVNDNCGATVTSTHNPGDFFIVGTTTVTYTADDGNGNIAVCSFDVIVTDTEAPVVSNCPANITQDNDTGLCGAVVTWTAPTFTDNCAVTVTSSHNPGDFFPVGTTTVTYTATDPSLNTATCSFTVTVNDVEAPQLTCPADITVAAVQGDCSQLVSWTMPTAIDNCAGAVTVTSSHPNPGLYPVGTTVVTLSAMDGAGNTATCTFNITVEDNENPVITGCPTNITRTTLPGQCATIVLWAPPTASDNCPGVTLTGSHTPGDIFTPGTTTVTYTAVDASGNVTTCSFTVTVIDLEPPVVTCPANITVSNDAGMCGAVVNFTPTATDNCPGVVITSVPASGSMFPVGTTTVVVTAVDASGNSSTCSFDVTVNDVEAPVVTCPANITVTNDAGVCGAIVNFTATATDNCPGVVITSVPASGDLFPVGTTTVVVTATDAEGNTSTCSFDVTVNDTENPVLVNCPTNITVSNDAGMCSASVTWTDPTATDNCPGVTITSTHASGDVFPVGTTTVVFTATDASGNTATCSFDVTVNDTEAPVIIDCPSDISVCGATTVTWTPPTATDNCTGVTLTSTHNPGDPFPIGTTTVVYTATDASGNTATCSFDVTIGPAIVVDAGPDVDICFGSFVTIGGSPTASAGTGSFTYSWSPAAGLDDPTIANPSASPIITTTYTVTVTDLGSGCTETDEVTVTVLPLPIADAGVDREVCIGGSTVLGGFPTADEGTAPYTYFWAPTVGLNDPTLSNPTATPTVTTTYTLVVSDANGCSRFDEVTVTVLDPPTVDAGVDVTICNGASILIGGAPTATGTTAPYAYFWTPATGLDDDRIANPTASPTATTTYTVTVIDAKGCTATDEITVTVNPAPVADAGADVTICDGQSTTIGGAPTASGSTAPYLFNWSPTTGLDDPTIANPVATPAVTTTYVVTVFDANGCIATDTVVVTVDPLPVVVADPVGPLCASDPAVMLTGTPAGGVWTGTGVTGNMFDPAVAGAGTFDVIYTYTSPIGCSNADTISIVVNSGPNSAITAAGPFCVTDAPQTLTAATAGGVFTGIGITNGAAGTFDPAVAGVGTHTITYTVAGPQGCISESTITITVSAAPDATINPVSAICVNAAPVTLTTVTAGGTFAGTGVNATTGVFDPSVAGVGTHTITYTVINAQGCSATGSLTVTVNAAPNAAITAAGPFCSSATPVALTAATAGGFWSGPGITDPFNGIFNPATAGVGTHTISYVVSNAQGCSSTATTTVTVNASPNATITAPGVQCESGAPITLTAATAGGTFSGPGVSGNTFNPGLAGVGTHVITYTVTVGGCTSVATTNITVTDAVVLNTNVNDIACAGNTDGSITVIPTGGSGQFTFNWSTGANTNTISGLAAGTYTVTVTDVLGCTVVASYDIIQVGGPITATSIVIPTLTPQYSNGVIDIQVSGGTPPYTYMWSNGATTQDVSGLAAGTYSVTVTDRLGCTQVFTYTVTAEFGTGVDLNSLVKNINVYPNPTSGVINLTIELGGVHDLGLQVFDMLGRRVYEMTDEIDSRYQHSIDMSSEAAGQYMMMINIDGHVITKKFNVTR